MTINGIQFQQGLSLPRFMEAYGTDAQCAAALIQARWPSGFRCPACSAAHAAEFRGARCATGNAGDAGIRPR